MGTAHFKEFVERAPDPVAKQPQIIYVDAPDIGGWGPHGGDPASAGPNRADDGPPPKDERRVRPDQVIGPRPGKLRYRYDFGDDWDHRITVVGSKAADGPLPRCTGGAGAAPQENSGGVWGWSEMVATAGDPRHPEHDDARDWLGLADGETIDPTAFDTAEVDQRLAHLRGGHRP